MQIRSGFCVSLASVILAMIAKPEICVTKEGAVG